MSGRTRDLAFVLLTRGDPVARLAEVAKDVGAAMIVCGSRQLGTVRRVLGHSVASELAGIANVAVAIVPF